MHSGISPLRCQEGDHGPRSRLSPIKTPADSSSTAATPQGCALRPSCGSSSQQATTEGFHRSSYPGFTSCVRQPTNACRERIMAIWAWAFSPRCWRGYRSFGSRRARRARFLRRRSRPFCACSGVDEPQFTSIGHQHLMTALL
jgi:hypothetical protein